MRSLPRHELDTLLNSKGLCCSIFLPMNPAGREGVGDPARLEKAVEDAERQLREHGCKTAQVREILEPVRALPETPRWETRGQSMAIFAGPGGTRFLSFDSKLEPEVWVDDHFHVRQLIPLVVESDRFFLLAISERRIQLFEGDADKLTPVEVPGAPANIDAALMIENADRGSQTHSGNAGGHGRAGTMYHGAGGKADAAPLDLREYFRQVADAVERRLNGHAEPLILATVAENVPVYRDVARRHPPLEAFVAGNPDFISLHELHEQAWKLIQDEIEKNRAAARQLLVDARHTPKTVAGPAQVLPSAAAGRVDTLFVDCRSPVSGTFDAENGTVEVQSASVDAETTDLLEAAIRETYLHRGKVLPLELASMGAEALLRY